MRNSMMNEEEIRLNKYIASCGTCSRRDADKLIEQKKVLVNGIVATAGTKVSTKDQVTVSGKLIQMPKKHVVLAYYKPVGVTCTERDSHAKKTVIEEVGYHKRVTYAGRLDKDSEGLLLLTDDGDLIQAMMKGANGHEKQYQVKVNKEITQEHIDKLSAGMYLSALHQMTRPCQVVKTGKYTFEMILTQGLNRQIRRMCGELELRVEKLKRIRVMNISIGQLKPGEVREIVDDELTELYKLTGLNK